MPILALAEGVSARQTPDYQRNATTTLVAPRNTLNGMVIQTWLPRHRHTECIDILEHIDRNVPKKCEAHIVMNNPVSRLFKMRHSVFRRNGAAVDKHNVEFGGA